MASEDFEDIEVILKFFGDWVIEFSCHDINPNVVDCLHHLLSSFTGV